jgi:hypothetical protein
VAQIRVKCFTNDRGNEFWKHTVAVCFVLQPGAECEGNTGDRNIRDTRPPMLCRGGHHMEPLHAAQISEILIQVCAGILGQDVPCAGHM